MFLFHDLKILYIIVPGTGSNSFHNPLRRKYINTKTIYPAADHPVKKMNNISHPAHLTAQQYKCLVEPHIWESYEKIAFVRHPYDWARTIYRKGGIPGAIGIDNTGTFLEYLQKLQKTPYYWFTDENGNVMVDTIYRTEDLNTTIAKKFKIVVGHENKTPAPQIELTDEHKQIIHEKFHREIEHYPEGFTGR